jgi:hypothetical protein
MEFHGEAFDIANDNMRESFYIENTEPPYRMPSHKLSV